MNRADWQRMAEEKLLAADAALAASLWSSAYHLAGLAVELGLKSCILARLAGFPEVIFDERNRGFSKECWTHDIEDLLDLAGLKSELDAARAVTPALATNWQPSSNGRSKAVTKPRRRSRQEPFTMQYAIRRPG